MPRSSSSVAWRRRNTQPERVTAPLDRDLLSLLGVLVAEATKSFEHYDYARVLERTESFFWSFCDNYVELVKTRAYGEGDEAATTSARATLQITLSVLQRLFAPDLALRQRRGLALVARGLGAPRELAHARRARTVERTARFDLPARL